jgi:hypothetical protein
MIRLPASSLRPVPAGETPSFPPGAHAPTHGTASRPWSPARPPPPRRSRSSPGRGCCRPALRRLHLVGRQVEQDRVVHQRGVLREELGAGEEGVLRQPRVDHKAAVVVGAAGGRARVVCRRHLQRDEPLPPRAARSTAAGSAATGRADVALSDAATEAGVEAGVLCAWSGPAEPHPATAIAVARASAHRPAVRRAMRAKLPARRARVHGQHFCERAFRPVSGVGTTGPIPGLTSVSWMNARTPGLSAEEQRVWRGYLTATRLLASQLDRELQRDSGSRTRTTRSSCGCPRRRTG